MPFTKKKKNNDSVSSKCRNNTIVVMFYFSDKIFKPFQSLEIQFIQIVSKHR